MIIRKSRAQWNPDGLQEVFEAYQELKRIYESAEVFDYVTGEHNGVMHWDTALRLPGTGQIVDPNDANTLNQLEQWLMNQLGKTLPEKEG